MEPQFRKIAALCLLTGSLLATITMTVLFFFKKSEAIFGCYEQHVYTVQELTNQERKKTRFYL